MDRVSSLVEERKRLERELAETKKKFALGGGGTSAEIEAKKLASSCGEVNFLGRVVEDISARELKGLVDDGKNSIGSGIVVICAHTPDGKAGIVVGVTNDLTDKFSAVDLVRAGSAAIGGKGGGGRPDMAQAGGPDGKKAAAAIEAIESAIRS